MPSTAFSSLRRRVATLFNPSLSSSSADRTKATATTDQQGVDSAQTAKKSCVPAGNPPPKLSKIIKNLRLPWKKRPSNTLPAQVPWQQHQDLEVAFQDSTHTVQAVHEPHNEHQHRLISRRNSGITVGTNRHSLWDTHSEFSVPSPRSPAFRYRMHYGPSIENIENMGEAYQPNDDDEDDCCHRFLTSEDEFVKELDKELAHASVRVMKKRNSKQLRIRLSIEGARPGSGSIVSSALSTPVSVVRCKTSRGTYDTSSCPSTPTTPTSSHPFLHCKTTKGSYDATSSSSPTTPISTRPFLPSSLPLGSPGFTQRFSSKVAPSPSSSRHASPKPPPLARLTSFSDLQDHQGPIMLTKEHIECIQWIQSRLRLLENSAPRSASSEHEQQQSHRQHPHNFNQQQRQQQVIVDHTPTSTPTQQREQIHSEELVTSLQQCLRAKPSLIRRVDTGYDHSTHMQQRRRISAIDRTDCQSPAGLSRTAEPRSFSFLDWGSRWNYFTATAAGSLNLSTAALASTAAAAAIRPSRHSNNNTDTFFGGKPTGRMEDLLEQDKERIASKIRLESSLWETEALLRQYKTLVVQDWELKLGNLGTSASNAGADTESAGQEQQQQREQNKQQRQQGLLKTNKRRVRNPPS